MLHLLYIVSHTNLIGQMTNSQLPVCMVIVEYSLTNLELRSAEESRNSAEVDCVV